MFSNLSLTLLLWTYFHESQIMITVKCYRLSLIGRPIHVLDASAPFDAGWTWYVLDAFKVNVQIGACAPFDARHATYDLLINAEASKRGNTSLLIWALPSYFSKYFIYDCKKNDNPVDFYNFQVKLKTRMVEEYRSVLYNRKLEFLVKLSVLSDSLWT